MKKRRQGSSRKKTMKLLVRQKGFIWNLHAAGYFWIAINPWMHSVMAEF